MIVSCGEALIDLFPADETNTEWQARPGGSPLNVAVAAARLGADAGFLGRVSTDRFGDLLRDHLAASGVSDRYVSIGDEPTALAVVEPGDDRHEPGFSFHGHGTADRALRPADAELGDEVDVVHFAGSVTLLAEPADAVLEAAMTGSRGRRLVTLDPNVRPTIAGSPERLRPHLDRWLAAADLVKVSRADIGWVEPGADPLDVAMAWIRRGPAVVVVTRGADGSVAVTPERMCEVPATPVEVADTVGAGDSYMGGLLTWLSEHDATTRPALGALDDQGWADALGFAGTVAAITSTRIGADPPSRDELAGA
ncbi:MAG: carbohydrate kinase [Actinomycetota bacterium]